MLVDLNAHYIAIHFTVIFISITVSNQIRDTADVGYRQARVYVAQTARTIHPSDRFTCGSACVLQRRVCPGNQGAVKAYFTAP